MRAPCGTSCSGEWRVLLMGGSSRPKRARLLFGFGGLCLPVRLQNIEGVVLSEADQPLSFVGLGRGQR